MGLNLSGIGTLLRRGIDDVGSAITGQPAQSNPTPQVQSIPQAPQPQSHPTGLLPAIGNTFHNDIVAPIQRDIVQPVQHFATPIVNTGRQLGSAAYHIAALPVETARTAAAEITNNPAATQAGVQRGTQGINALKGLAQGTASMAYQLGESVNPSGGDVYNRSHTFTGLPAAVFGSAPIPSMQKQYKDTSAAHGGAYGAGEALTTALMDAVGAKGAVEGVPGVKPALETAGKGVATGAKAIDQTMKIAQKNENAAGAVSKQLASNIQQRAVITDNLKAAQGRGLPDTHPVVRNLQNQLASNIQDEYKIRQQAPQRTPLQVVRDKVLTAQPGMSMKAVSSEGMPEPVSLHGAGLSPMPEPKGINGESLANAEKPLQIGKKPLSQENPTSVSGIKQIRLGSKLPGEQLGKTADGSLVQNTSDFNPKQYIEEQTAKQQMARDGEKPSLGIKLNNLKSDLRSKFVDSFSPIEDKIDAAKRAGVQIDPEHEIRYAIDRALRSDTIGSQYVSDHGLDKIIQNVPDTKTFDQYLIAKHAQDLEAAGVKTGRDLAKDRQLVQHLHDEYEPYAQQLKQYNHGLLDKTAEYGLIHPDTAATLKEKYPNYVPANRIFSEEEQAGKFQGSGSGKASISNQTVVQKIKGSERQIESPLHSILQKTHDVINQGERNKAAQILASYKDLPGNPLQLRKMKPDETVGIKPVISHFENGKQIRYETTPEVAAAAKSLNKEQLGLVGKIFSYPTRVLRLGATSLNPAFSLANLAKDQASAFINSDHALRTSVANPKVFVQGLKAAFNHSSPEYAELRREGAGGTSFDIARDEPKKNIEIIRANKNVGTRAVYQLQHPIRSVGDLVTAVENTIGRTEEMTRAMQYFGNKAAFLKDGKTVSDARLMAADAARNNTVNFARAGTYGRVLNTVLPYLNAGVQGSRTLMRNLRERPAQTATKIALTNFLPVAAVTAWNLNDPKRKQAYDDIRDYEKQGNIIIVPPNPVQDPKTGRWNVIKIPVSQEVANLNNVVRNGVEALKKDKGFDFGSMAGDLAGTVTSLNLGSKRQIANQLTPQAVKPGVENLTNQNLFTGQQIVPDAQKNLAPQDQYNKTTSGTAKFVGNALGISPEQIDNTIRTSTGGLGQNLVNLSDKALAGTGKIPQSDVHGTPFGQAVTNRFDSAAGATPGAEYFTNLQKQAQQQHLAGKDYSLLNALTSKEVDQNGNPVPTDIRTKLENSAIRASSPQILAVETAAAKATAQQTGRPLDPFYNLTPDQQKTAVVIEARKALDNSDTQAALMKQENPWLDQFYKDRAAYFQANKPVGNGVVAPRGDLNMPLVSQQVSDDMNGAKGLAGAEYATYMKAHPELTQYYSDLDKAVRAQHDYFNEPQYKSYPTPSTRVQQLLDSMPKGTDSAAKKGRYQITKDPEVSNYLADIAMWQLNKGADKAQYEGQDYTQKDLKNLYSIGNYDVVKLPNGQYAQIAGTLSNGQALAGHGYSTGGGAGFTAGNTPAGTKGGGSGSGYGSNSHMKLIKRHTKPIRVYHPKKTKHPYKFALKTPKSYLKFKNNSKHTLRVADDSKQHIKLG